MELSFNMTRYRRKSTKSSESNFMIIVTTNFVIFLPVILYVMLILKEKYVF
jgi:hypothetical protein